VTPPGLEKPLGKVTGACYPKTKSLAVIPANIATAIEFLSTIEEKLPRPDLRQFCR